MFKFKFNFRTRWKAFNGGGLHLYRKIWGFPEWNIFFLKFMPHSNREHAAKVRLNKASSDMEEAYKELLDARAESKSIFRKIKGSCETEAHVGPTESMELPLFRPATVPDPGDAWKKFEGVLRNGRSSISDGLGLSSVQEKSDVVLFEDDDVIILEEVLPATDTQVVGSHDLEIKHMSGNNRKKRNGQNNQNNGDNNNN